MSKYRLLRQRVEQHADRLSIELHLPPPAGDEQLLRVHSPEYVNSIVQGTLEAIDERRIGFPWSPQLVERSRRSTGATVAAAIAALTEQVAVNLAGGTHHAFANRGQGYCVFNDIAVAARVLQVEHQVDRIVVVDCDVHQGNGTAEIFAEDESVFTVSLHGARNFPFTKVPSDFDVAFENGTTDEEYLAALHRCLEQIEKMSFDFAFYLAGADPFLGDRLGKLKLTKAGLKARDDAVLKSFVSRQNLPAAVAMGGGYAPELKDIVDIHMQTVEAAAQCASSN